MKKHKMEKDLLKDFFFHLRENDFTITKKIVPKSYERTNYKVDGERTIVNFSCVIENKRVIKSKLLYKKMVGKSIICILEEKYFDPPYKHIVK